MPILQYKKRILRSVTEYTNITCLSDIVTTDTSVLTRCHPSIIGVSDHNPSIELSQTKTRCLHIFVCDFCLLVTQVDYCKQSWWHYFAHSSHTNTEMVGVRIPITMEGGKGDRKQTLPANR